MQEDMRQLETEQATKQHYEKPSIAAVRLFADQVLQCNPEMNPEEANKLS